MFYVYTMYYKRPHKIENYCEAYLENKYYIIIVYYP